MFSLIFLIQIYCRVPINKNIVITNPHKKSHQMVVYDKIVRMKELPLINFTPHDPNIAQIFAINKQYLIKFGAKFLFKPTKSVMIEANNYDENDFGFIFDIFESPDGFTFVTHDKQCLAVGELLSTTDGNVIVVEECNKSPEQTFFIKLLENSGPGLESQERLGLTDRNLSDQSKKERKTRKSLLS